MTDAGGSQTAFGVETIELDLPPLVGGVQPAPARRRRADDARALGRLRAGARTRAARSAAGGCTGPRARCSSPTRARSRPSTRCSSRSSATAYDTEAFEPDVAAAAATAADDRAAADHSTTAGDSEPRDSREGAWSSPPDTSDDEDAGRGRGAAGDGERRGAARGARASTRSSPHELAQLYRLMSRLQLATPLRRTRRYEQGRRGQHIDMRRTLRAQPAHRRRSDPARPPPAARRPRAGW